MSTSGGTRAARAATSRQAKQEIVRLLFGKKYSQKGREGHRLLDYSIYSYADLKKAYLERVQEIHPDKLKQQQPRQPPSSLLVQGEDTTNRYLHTSSNHFHELQSAWEKYDEIAKDMMKTFNKNDGAVDSNFTTFGVGCSFSDNEEERALRNEITDQACRGWFSSGALSAGTGTSTTTEDDEDPSSNTTLPRSKVALADEDMFAASSVVVDSINIKDNNDDTIKSMSKTLIPGLRIIPRKS